MKRTLWVVGAVCLAGLTWSLAVAQDKKDEPKKAEPPKKAEEAKPAQPAKPAEGAPKAGDKEKAGEMPFSAEEMQKWMEYNTLGAEHKALGKLVGKWDYALKWWMDAKQADAQESKGACEYKWILDEHFIEQHVTGPAEGPDGKPFKGLGLLGYDNLKKEYVNIWGDNMGTGLMVTYGKKGADGTLTFTGEMQDPMAGKMVKVRMTIKHDSDDKHTMEMFSPGKDGKEFRSMEITYTRAK